MFKSVSELFCTNSPSYKTVVSELLSENMRRSEIHSVSLEAFLSHGNPHLVEGSVTHL